MKKIIVLLALAVVSCSTHSTAPHAAATDTTAADTTTPVKPIPPKYPFLQKFKKAVVSYSNVPQRHYTSNNGLTNADTQSASSSFTYMFDTTTFKQYGDTITASGTDPMSDPPVAQGGWSAYLIVDQNSGIIDSISLEYSFEAAPGNEFEEYSSYGIRGRQIPYHSDSSGTITAKVTGAALQKSLVSLTSGSWQNGYGYPSESENYTYLDSILSTSSVTIQFIP